MNVIRVNDYTVKEMKEAWYMTIHVREKPARRRPEGCEFQSRRIGHWEGRKEPLR